MKKLILFFVVFILALSLYAEENSKFKFSGHANLYHMYSTNDYVNQNNRNTNDFKLNGQLDVNAQYKPIDNLEFNTTVVLGNYLNLLSSDPYNSYTKVKADLYYLNAKYIDKTVGDINVGRYGFKVNPYVFQRKWNDFYFENPLTQDGNFSVLGANIKNNNLKNFSYNVWFSAPQYTIFDDELLYTERAYQPYSIGGSFGLGKIKNFYGAELGYDFKVLKLSALYSEANSDYRYTNKYAEKAKVYGLSVNAPIQNVNINANYYEQKLDKGYINNIAVDDRAKFFNIAVKGNFNKFNAGLEYMYVDPAYDAPGDWMFYGYGTFKNVKGLKANVGYKFDNRFYAYGEIDGGSLAKGDKLAVSETGDPVYALLGLDYTVTPRDIIQGWYKYHGLKFEDDLKKHESTFNIKYRHDFGKGLAAAIGYEYDHINPALLDNINGNMIYTQVLYSF